MKTKREESENAVNEEEGGATRQKLIDQSSTQLAFENPLLPLASYDDDDEEEEDDRRDRGGGRLVKNGRREEENRSKEDDEDDEEESGAQRSCTMEVRRDCPYLDTVNRQVLDFDFEKFCSVSLSNLNVYACLVCGKYYQGRGQKSHAYTHSLAT